MKKCFQYKNLSGERLQLIDLCNEIIENYSAQGYELTVRQLYYQLVSRDLIPNTIKSYTKIQGLINDGRMSGLIDWSAIVDRGRKVIIPSSWREPSSILSSAAHSFQIDHWDFQPCHVIVMCEKQALEGVLEPACARWGLPYTSNKGYASVSLLYGIGQQIQDDIFQTNRDAHVIYFGDHDPSGLDMDRDLQDRLAMFSEAHKFDNDLIVTRAALTEQQIEAYQPPPNPAKISDSRAKKYIEEHGAYSWELDALEPSVLVEILDTCINEALDASGSREIWDESHELENKMQSELDATVEQAQNQDWSTPTNELYKHRDEQTDY